MHLPFLLPALSVLLSFAPAEVPAPSYERVHTLMPREGVFAYARISPDGRRLVYASRPSALPVDPRGFNITLVDLATHEILFEESGIDAYWSNDGSRLIYAGRGGVVIRDMETGESITSDAAASLGDYFSWGVRDGRDLILTIESNYYYLDEDGPVLPHTEVRSCDGIGTGDRPILSKDGRWITTFVDGNVVVRGLDHCDDIFDTGIQGAKADFSWDGRYIAFHAVKPDGTGYEIKIVDLEERTVRTLPGLEGSAIFPSWTRDGRLCFRYDGPDFRGFMMATDVLDAPAELLPAVSEAFPRTRTWDDIFPEAKLPSGDLQMVLIWAPWSAHSLEAFEHLEKAREHYATRGPDLWILAAADPASPKGDVTRQLEDFRVTIPRIELSVEGLVLTEARNQMPSTLLFRDGVLIGKKLGAKTFEELRAWVDGVAGLE